MANKKTTNQKITVEFDPFDDPEFGKYYLESFFDNEEENIRKAREFSAELRKKNQQQESERQRKGKKEKDQIGSSSQDTPVFGIDNSLQGSQPTFDLGRSPTYEKMKIISEKKKKRGLKFKYVNKTVDPSVPLTDDEKLLGKSIFSTQQEEEEEVFNDNECASGISEDKQELTIHKLQKALMGTSFMNKMLTIEQMEKMINRNNNA
ncbi:hypothetical protein Tco_0479222 [Tanacetum coccineum]